MYTDVLGWMIHYTLTHANGAWLILTVALCLATAFIVLAIGFVRWWHIKRTSLPWIWARHRRELNKVIAEQGKIIEKQDKEIHFYKHCSYVGAVMKLQDEAEKEARNEA